MLQKLFEYAKVKFLLNETQLNSISTKRSLPCALYESKLININEFIDFVAYEVELEKDMNNDKKQN